jgi:rare lipoprotein A
MKKIVVALLCAGLAACASAPRPSSPPVAPVVQPPAPVASAHDCSWYRPAEEDLSKRGDYVAGGLYRPSEKDRTPSVIPDISCIPEPQVVALPRSKIGNNPVYRVLDKEYRVLADTHGFAEEGLASYYGEKFHGRLTSNREVYDMYAYSAAHKTLPIPSFARVTNLDTGKSVVVRVNDRGPFHDGRVMDLSLAAAVKLGVYPAGTGRVRVEALQPGDAASGSTFAAAPTALDAGTRDYRYAMRTADGQTPAQGFDDWMKQRGVRVATGRPTLVASNDADPPAGVPPVTAASAPVAAPAEAALAAAAPLQAAPSSAAIVATPLPPPLATTPSATPAMELMTLQVASFSARDNADRALATVRGAGIVEARLLDAAANGQPIWRLRIGPVPASREAELAARVRGLGFGSPQRVRD